MFFENLQNKLSKITNTSLTEVIYKNILINSKISKKHLSIKNFRGKNFNNSKVALIVAGGPSLRKNDFRKSIIKFREKFYIICADGTLYYLLEKKIIPDLVVTLDPHKKRIVRWFGDKKLSKEDIAKDDYYRRQDIDLKFRNEVITNKKILKYTNKYGKILNIAPCTSSSKSVVNRLVEMKSKLYWWNPFLDNPQKKNSLTKKIYKINKLPIINSIGNVGSACWVMAESVFNFRKIALIGMDNGYYIDTPIKATQYYDILTKTFGKKNIKKFYKKIYNKKIKKYFYTDHVYFWYKSIFLDAVKSSTSRTFNCTEGGIIFEKPIITIKFKDFCKTELTK